MRNYFYQINRNQLEGFTKSVRQKFSDLNIKTNISFLKVLFKEINELFHNIGGMTSSKKMIPRDNFLPSSTEHNKLVSSISNDISKIYKSQTVIENDLNNLLNFNSMQRRKIFENLTLVQQRVYSQLVKNKHNIIGEYNINTVFSDSELLASDSSNTTIDELRGVLTLSSISTQSKPVILSDVNVSFLKNDSKLVLYPEGSFLGVGSHWKKESNDQHFIDTSNPTSVIEYKKMMVDDPNYKLGVGWSEFESVTTRTDSQTSTILKNYIGEIFKKDQESIYLDISNSLQGKYINYDNSYLLNDLFFKVIIPFNTTSISNEIIITFGSNEESGDTDGGLYPFINWELSKLWSKDTSFNLIKPNNINFNTSTGTYSCKILSQGVIPSRLELIVGYSGNPWQYIPFYMSHYNYTISKGFNLQSYGNETTSLILKKTYDIFVDAEVNDNSESMRALNVLIGYNKEKL